MQNIKLRDGLPENAKLVFKGVIFEVWQWEQKMFDGSAQTFEAIWRPPTVEIIAVVNHQLLIEDQHQPNNRSVICLPSGRADQSENMLEEAKRELLEETGYESSDWVLFMKHGKGGKVISEVFYFIAKNCKKTKKPQLDAGEDIKTKFIDFEDFVALVDEPRFSVSPQFINYLLQLQLDHKKKIEFKETLFN